MVWCSALVSRKRVRTSASSASALCCRSSRSARTCASASRRSNTRRPPVKSGSVACATASQFVRAPASPDEPAPPRAKRECTAAAAETVGIQNARSRERSARSCASINASEPLELG